MYPENIGLDKHNILWYKLIMATIRRQRVGKYTYWQIVESKRVNGKPRPVVLAHLGTAQQLLYKLRGGEFRKKIKSYSHGACKALWNTITQNGILNLFDMCFSDQDRNGLSVGRTLLAASIQRILKPGSKNAFEEFAKETTLPKIMGFEEQKVTSQDFWQQMDTVTEEQMLQAERQITAMLNEKGHLSSKYLFYDTTNFFTYISSENTRCKIAKRGKNKQKRSDLRQIGLAQVATKEFLLPVFTKVYEGNKTDKTLFKPFLTEFREKMKVMEVAVEEITLVFDKGNNTKVNFATLDKEQIKYVASVSVAHNTDLLDIPESEYREVMVNGEKTNCYMTRKEIWGKERIVVIYKSEKLRRGQIRGLVSALKKKEEALSNLKSRLGNPRARKTTAESLKIKIQKLLKGEKCEEIIKYEIIDLGEGRYDIDWYIDGNEYDRITKEVFGKKILITCHSDWDAAEIISAYNAQGNIERIFRSMKNPLHHGVRPQYHWTDQKIQVHIFICIIALLISQLLTKQAREAGYDISTEKLLDQLMTVREAEVYIINDLKGRPKKEIQLEEMDDELKEMYEKLVEKVY
jgi:transposase